MIQLFAFLIGVGSSVVATHLNFEITTFNYWLTFSVMISSYLLGLSVNKLNNH